MMAEIGIDEEGRAYLHITPANPGEASLLKYMRSFLPFAKPSEFPPGHDVRIIGDRLPGSGRSDR